MSQRCRQSSRKFVERFGIQDTVGSSSRHNDGVFRDYFGDFNPRRDLLGESDDDHDRTEANSNPPSPRSSPSPSRLPDSEPQSPFNELDHFIPSENINEDPDPDVDAGLDDLQAEFDARQEQGWEPFRLDAGHNGSENLKEDVEEEDGNSDGNPDGDDDEARDDIHQNAYDKKALHDGDTLRVKPVIERFPGEAGNPVAGPDDEEPLDDEQENPYSPFTEMDWMIARWAKLRGPGSTAFTELLAIDGVQERLGLTYSTTQELNTFIDKYLTTRRPCFQKEELVLGGEVCDLYYRDPLACIRALWGDPDFADHLVFAPEKHFLDVEKATRLYHEMHTGKWWWRTQEALDKKKQGGTIIPLIISSDQTQLTTFGGKSAYPVYMTIGNIPKEIRRKPSRHAYVLLGYIPIPTLDGHGETSTRRMKANLFHACMRKILSPLYAAGKTGVKMRSGNGIWRHCHPIFATFVGDYPEQTLVTCVKRGQCPLCEIPHDEIGETCDQYPHRNLQVISTALGKLSSGATAFRAACRAANIKEVQQPFWFGLPYANIYYSITPDILHQIYQGIVKHIITWLRAACGDAEINARCRRLPLNHQLRYFGKGITHLSRVTGREHSQITSLLLSLVIDTRLTTGASSPRLVQAIRGILDVIYLAQYPVHSPTTLTILDNSLAAFHDNKEVFRDLGIRSNFNIPKLHSLDHYVESIKLFGTTDNYNTEYTERLHIDMAKEAYRSTNFKDEFPQMTIWLERREKIFEHESLIKRRIAGNQPQYHPASVGVLSTWSQKLTKHPSAKGITTEDLITTYGATHITQCLSEYIMRKKHPNLSRQRISALAQSMTFPEVSFSVYHTLKFTKLDPYNIESDVSVDAVHAKPSHNNKRGQVIPPRFDTVLLAVKSQPNSNEVTDYRVARIRAIFAVPSLLLNKDLPNETQHIVAYVDIFTRFSQDITNGHGLYQIRQEPGSIQTARVIPVANIARSVHLFPKFGLVAPVEWTASNVLDECKTFFVNPFSDRQMYYMFG